MCSRGSITSTFNTTPYTTDTSEKLQAVQSTNVEALRFRVVRLLHGFSGLIEDDSSGRRASAQASFPQVSMHAVST